MSFWIDLQCSQTVEHHKQLQKSYTDVTRYEFYDDFGIHYFMIHFEEKPCSKVATVLRVRNAQNPQRLGDIISIYG